MRYAAHGLALTLPLALGMLLIPASVCDTEDDKEIAAARKDVLEVAKDVANGKDISKKVAAIRKKYEDFGVVAHIYKPRSKGGIGFGSNPKYGIEFKIRDLSKRRLAPAVLKQESTELIRLGHINVAMSQITRAYLPEKELPGGRTKKEWLSITDDMKKAAWELTRAVKAGDPKALKNAAEKLDSTCNNCHSCYDDR